MRKKLINVCEDLTVGGQVLHIKELEGKWLTDEEGGEGVDFKNLDWYYVIDLENSTNYVKINFQGTTIVGADLNLNNQYVPGGMLGILGFTKGYVPTEEFSVEAQKEDCLFGLAGEEFNEFTVRPSSDFYFVVRYSVAGKVGNDGIGRSIWYVPDFGEQAGQLVNARVLVYSDDRSYVYPEEPQPGTYYISSDDFSPVEDPFVGDDEEEYKSNFVAKFRVTGENVMKNRYSRFEDPDGILLLRL